MTKAFDFVHHDVLKNKMEKYGIRGKPLDWLNDYLSGRKQCTTISRITNGQKKTFESLQKINMVFLKAAF